MSLGDFRSIFMPYCLQRQKDGSWLVLNREYKPVGFNTRAHIDYADYPVSVRLKGIGPAKLAKLSYKADFNPERVYLYNDGCVPTDSAANMNAYLGRLRILASLHVDDRRG